MTTWTHLAEVCPLPPELWPAGAGGGYRIRYRDSGRVSSGSVFLPAGEPASMPLLTWAHCFVGLDRHSAPSVCGLPRVEREHLSGWLARGFAVAAADFKGLDGCGLSPFPGTHQIAADLMGICPAARELDERIEKTVLAGGFCQGGRAALHAAHPGFELNYKGAVALAPPDYLPYFTEVTADADRPADALILVLLAGMRGTDASFRPEDFLTRTGAECLSAITSLSVRQMRELLAPYTVGDLGVHRVAARTPVTAALTRCRSLPPTPTKSFLVCTIEADPVSPPASAARSCAQLAGNGAEVVHRTYTGGAHMDVLGLAAADVLEWAVEHAV
ncbi:hypothetical protein AB0H76_37550 [Nocardia sp. NPDC050712]|uniref:hypothetical protein n=1 Tax=Nocardia sp. NPDC050712 TaxID=3155518 RepID=UPI0033E19124